MNNKGMSASDWYQYELDITGMPPNMEDCPVPTLNTNNEIAYQIYLLVRDQLLTTGMGDIIGVNLLAIIELLNLYEDYLIEEKTLTFEKIYTACSVYITYLKKQIEKQTKNK